MIERDESGKPVAFYPGIREPWTMCTFCQETYPASLYSDGHNCDEAKSARERALYERVMAEATSENYVVKDES